MFAEAISRSRYLVAWGREARASVQHTIETSREKIRHSQSLIERATQTRNEATIGSESPASPDVNTRSKRLRSPRAGRTVLAIRGTLAGDLLWLATIAFVVAIITGMFG